jgi:hypothetical protein
MEERVRPTRPTTTTIARQQRLLEVVVVVEEEEDVIVEEEATSGKTRDSCGASSPPIAGRLTMRHLTAALAVPVRCAAPCRGRRRQAVG